MSSRATLEKVASELLETKGLSLQSCKVIQTLWAGYGHIARVTATSRSLTKSSESVDTPQTYILKHVSPPSLPPRQQGSRSKSTIDEGHVRKLLSYQIEQSFYVHLVPLIPEDIAVASCLAHAHLSAQQEDASDNVSATLLLTDLRRKFPLAGEDSTELTTVRVHAALSWLANFHGFWWKRVQNSESGLRWQECVLPPLEHVAKHGNASLDCYESHPDKGMVWQRGGYSHLATRQKEYESLKTDKRSEWSRKLCQPVRDGFRWSVAELVDMFLYPSSEDSHSSNPYRTLIHGDVKSENLFSTLDGTQVAFYDFQYVGLGLGVSDLAKLFTVSIPLTMLVDDEDDVYSASDIGLEMASGEERLLRKYCEDLEARAGQPYEWSLFVRHWNAALVDWLRFQASWGFWGNTDWLEGRVRRILHDKEWLRWLIDAVKPG